MMLLLKKLHDNVSVTKIYLKYNFFLLDQCQLTGTLIQLIQGHTSTYENSWKNPNLQERLLFLFQPGYDSSFNVKTTTLPLLFVGC